MTSGRSTISFYAHFEADIASGAKTLTLRDLSYGDVAPGDTLNATIHATGRVFGTLLVRSCEHVTFGELDRRHAERENMPLGALKHVLHEIYPGVQEFIAIDFVFGPV